MECPALCGCSVTKLWMYLFNRVPVLADVRTIRFSLYNLFKTFLRRVRFDLKRLKNLLQILFFLSLLLDLLPVQMFVSGETEGGGCYTPPLPSPSWHLIRLEGKRGRSLPSTDWLEKVFVLMTRPRAHSITPSPSLPLSAADWSDVTATD